MLIHDQTPPQRVDSVPLQGGPQGATLLLPCEDMAIRCPAIEKWVLTDPEPGMVAHNCNPSSWEDGEFTAITSCKLETSLDDMRLYLKMAAPNAS